MSGEVIVDALPYYDTGYDETGVRDAAMSLVEEEMKRYRPTKNYLDIIPPANYTSYETKLMRTEFERIQGRLPQEPLIMKRYELPGPSSGRMNDINAWKDCVNNSRSQLEHQVIRIENLQLLSKFGPEAWKMYSEELTRIYEVAERRDMEIRKDIQNINWNRKNEQTAAGAQLKELENSWVSLVTKNYEIEQACVDLERRRAAAAAEAALRGEVVLTDQEREQIEQRRHQQAVEAAHKADSMRDAGIAIVDVPSTARETGDGEGTSSPPPRLNGTVAGDVEMEDEGDVAHKDEAMEGELTAEQRSPSKVADSRDGETNTSASHAAEAVGVDEQREQDEDDEDSPPEKKTRMSSEEE